MVGTSIFVFLCGIAVGLILAACLGVLWYDLVNREN